VRTRIGDTSGSSELRGLGVEISPSSVRAILSAAGIPPTPQRDGLSWRRFLRQQASAIVACDFLTVETLWLQRIYILFFISLERRRIEFVAATKHPNSLLVTQPRFAGRSELRTQCRARA